MTIRDIMMAESGMGRGMAGPGMVVSMPGIWIMMIGLARGGVGMIGMRIMMMGEGRREGRA